MARAAQADVMPFAEGSLAPSVAWPKCRREAGSHKLIAPFVYNAASTAKPPSVKASRAAIRSAWGAPKRPATHLRRVDGSCRVAKAVGLGCVRRVNSEVAIVRRASGSECAIQRVGPQTRIAAAAPACLCSVVCVLL